MLDPNESYEVVPIEPGPHGSPEGWWAVKGNDFVAKIVRIWSQETERKSEKIGNWRAFLGFMDVQSQVAGLPGWRRSADRTRLQANSLLTRNFTGNLTISVSQKPISLHETAVLQRLLLKFPTRIIRENNLKNKEF